MIADVQPQRASQHSQFRIQGTGPLLIYIAGLDGTGELFFKQAPTLARSYRVVTYRSRDHDSFTYDDLTGDIARIIEQLSEQKATIVGESFGGTVALSFALRYPRMTDRLVVINSFPRFRGRLRIRLAALLASKVPFRLLWPFRRAANIIGLSIDRVCREDRRRFWAAIRTVNAGAYARRLQLIADFNVEDRLGEIRAPTMFVAGGRDSLIRSSDEARTMASRVPNATVRVIEGAGHACLLGDRVSLADLLSEWLSVV